MPITPEFREVGTPKSCFPEKFPDRRRNISLLYERGIEFPEMKRADAIEAVTPFLSDTPVVCNPGVPCKQLYRADDRPENPYTPGSYTQVTQIGPGSAFGQERSGIC